MPLFAHAGFTGTTTRRIAQAAGVSEALVFQHFPSKAALYEAIVRQGCDGDPALQKLLALPPSTGTLVGIVELMLEHLVLGCLDEPGAKELHDRLTLHSLLEDGDYARQMRRRVGEEIAPLFTACLEAAWVAGDLVFQTKRPVNLFWFSEHVAAMIGYTQTSTPYTGTLRSVIEDASLFILRGLGLREDAIGRHRGSGVALIETLQVT